MNIPLQCNCCSVSYFTHADQFYYSLSYGPKSIASAPDKEPPLSGFVRATVGPAHRTTLTRRRRRSFCATTTEVDMGNPCWCLRDGNLRRPAMEPARPYRPEWHSPFLPPHHLVASVRIESGNYFVRLCLAANFRRSRLGPNRAGEFVFRRFAIASIFDRRGRNAARFGERASS